LTREEEAEPDGIPATFKAKSFKVPVLKLLEHSNIAEKGCDDMVDIDELNPATLLYNLAGRYKRDEVYTYVGPILLALNPFKKIERLYGDAFNNQYLAIANCEAPLSMKRELPPHQNALSAVAYSGLKNEKKR
jgi:myosin heavy subunit